MALADDKTTDGSGKKAAEGDPGTEAGKETQGEENKDAATLAAEAAAKATADAAAKAAAKAAVKPEDEKTFSQADVNRMITERLDREKKKKAGEFETLFNETETKRLEAEARLAELEAEAKEEREAAKSALQAEVDALPEEVKALAPSISTKGGLKAVREWLPKGKALAAKLGEKAKVPGNEGDPPPAGPSGDKLTSEQITAIARKHSIYNI